MLYKGVSKLGCLHTTNFILIIIEKVYTLHTDLLLLQAVELINLKRAVMYYSASTFNFLTDYYFYYYGRNLTTNYLVFT